MSRNALAVATEVLAVADAAHKLDAFARTLPSRPHQIDRLRNELVDHTVALLQPYTEPEKVSVTETPEPTPAAVPQHRSRKRHVRGYSERRATHYANTHPRVGLVFDTIAHMPAALQADFILQLVRSLPPLRRDEVLSLAS